MYASQPHHRKLRTPRPFEREGKEIVALQGRMGMSRQQMAFMLGTTELTVWRWEVGEFKPEGAAAALIEALKQRVPPELPQPNVGEVLGKVAIGAAAGVALLAVLGALFGGTKE